MAHAICMPIITKATATQNIIGTVVTNPSQFTLCVRWMSCYRALNSGYESKSAWYLVICLTYGAPLKVSLTRYENIDHSYIQ